MIRITTRKQCTRRKYYDNYAGPIGHKKAKDQICNINLVRAVNFTGTCRSDAPITASSMKAGLKNRTYLELGVEVFLLAGFIDSVPPL